jgi:hypothetical protein
VEEQEEEKNGNYEKALYLISLIKYKNGDSNISTTTKKCDFMGYGAV